MGTSPYVKYDVLELLSELHDARGEIKRLRRRVRELEASRASWRERERGLHWHTFRRVRRSSRGEAVAATGRAEASVGG